MSKISTYEVEERPKIKGKPGRPKLSSVVINCSLPREAVRQLDRLARVLNIQRGAVISQAISKLYHTEPLIQKQRQLDAYGRDNGRHNGDGNT
jgi:predicted transcriptional regulator